MAIANSTYCQNESCGGKLNKKNYINGKVQHHFAIINAFLFLIAVDGHLCNQTNSFQYRNSCLTLHFEPVSWSVVFINCKKQAKTLAMMKTIKAVVDISSKIKSVYREDLDYWVGLRKVQWYMDDKSGIFSFI